MSAQSLMFAELFEAGMLACFGVSWPVAVLRTLRTRQTEGKSLAFLVLIFVGYLLGIAAKFVLAGEGGGLQPVTALYGFNATFVGLDILLYLRYRPRRAAKESVDTGPGR